MLKKLLIKSLSTGGELLSVVSCFAGQVSVFRAHSPSELKPYQRALAGLQGAEKYSVSLDSGEYLPQNHTLVGFAEQKLSGELTVRAFFEKAGATSETVDSLLLSYGLDKSVDKTLSELSSDEERRVRLLEATFHPLKALIINEPFEPVSSQWRERFAELLVSFARNKGALVIITSLSYRPECWIDNDSIQRIQVGENSQRTIGYGSAGSQANQMMNQIRDAVRNDSSNEKATTAAVGASAAATIGMISHEPPGHMSWIKKFLAENPLALKVTVASSIVAATGAGLLLYSSQQAGSPGQSIETKTEIAQTLNPSIDPKVDINIKSPETVSETGPTTVIQPPQAPEIQAPPAMPMVLDGYPELIRASLISTSNGDTAYKDSLLEGPPPTEENKGVKPSGNLFNLLETASSKQTPGTATEEDSGNFSQPQTYDQVQEPEQQTDEQQRREAIRQKFLEAIRAAAERRQQAQQDVE